MDKIKHSNKTTGNSRALIKGYLYQLQPTFPALSELFENTFNELDSINNDATTKFIRSLDEDTDENKACRDRMKEKIEIIENQLLELLNNLTTS